MSVAPLTAVAVEPVVSVLCDAFADYPVMRYVLGREHAGEASAHERLVRFFAMARVLRGEPMLGVHESDALVAVALASDPYGPPPPAELAALRARVWQELGAEAEARYAAFGVATAGFADERPHLHLNMLGVRRSHHGRGIGRALLGAVQRLSVEHPRSAGVSLTTEDPRNLPFYRNAGYEIVGHARVAPELETWGFFRAD